MNAPYGSWASPLDPAALTRGIKGFVDLQSADGMLFLLESRPEESGRTTLLQLDPTQPDATPIELTPAPFNVRSRVHEYGGGSFIASTTQVIFINFADQNLYRVALQRTTNGLEPSPPVAITASDSKTRFADFVITPDGEHLIAVCEEHAESTEPKNCLVRLELNATTGDAQPQTIHAGHDFYACPRVSPDGSELAFVVWDHPNMPWDETRLLRAPLSQIAPLNVACVAGGNNSSITQPHWHGENQPVGATTETSSVPEKTPAPMSNRLGFIADDNGFWNLYVTAAQGNRCVHADNAEYASPAWVFGQRECVVLPDGGSVCVRQHESGASICVLANPDRATVEPQAPRVLSEGYASYSALCTDHRKVWCLADRVDNFACLLEIDLATGHVKTLRDAGLLSLPGVSTPEPLRVQNRDNETTHAWFYPPLALTGSPNPDAGTKPPLLVLSHGGPTSACSPALNLRIQYYTSRGWAVADVNYAGSTGFGRAYRDRLRNQWGVADVADCEDIALHLAAAGRVDAERMAIKGGSAGGYTTLAALTFGDVFAAGASHYGIGDLNALAADTHKFEARYIDGLVPKSDWNARSPINSVDKLSCPVIFFQGADDAVVPPNQAQAMVAALRQKGLPVAYIEFAGEGHGFRQASNIQHAVNAEYQFFCTMFGIPCPDAPIELTIENLP